MIHKFDAKPLLLIVPDSLEPAAQAPSEPVMLAFLVAEALRKVDLVDAVLQMRRFPANWLDFLVQLNSFLEEGPVV